VGWQASHFFGRSSQEKTCAALCCAAPQINQKRDVKASEPAEDVGPSPESFFDPELGDRGLKRMERRRRAGFSFVEEGNFQKQAEIQRLRVRRAELIRSDGQAV
jgi:hypothetical protein